MPAPNAPHSLTRDYDAQLRRAALLSSTHAAAGEILAFYSKILSFQKSLVTQIASTPRAQRNQFASLRDSLDLALLLPHFRPFLSVIAQHAPAPLSSAAHELAVDSTSNWAALLAAYWQTGGLPENAPPSAPDVAPPQEAGPLKQFFPRAFLQPYAALLASQIATPPTASTPSLCPVCGALPLLGILRPEGDGGKRSLLCAFCSTEWSFRRILCPNCCETREPSLPVFIADQFPHMRTEACDTCHSYVRTVDLTKDGHAVPVVDDLAALPLSLWAHEHHYTRLYPNLLST